jgi:hypothetical protein
MSLIDIKIIKEKLRPFVPDPDELIREIVDQTRVENKQKYSPDEVDAMLDNMVLRGGFVEFVGKILKSKMAMDGAL